MTARDFEQADAGAPPSWRKSFALLWTGSAASQLGTMCMTLAAPLLALKLTGSPVFAGWVTAAGTLPGLLLHIPAGIIVDRSDRRLVMLVSQIIRLGTVGLVAVALFALPDPPPALLLIGALADGACSTFFNMAEFTAIRRIVPDRQMSGAMAKNESRSHLALLLGRPLGGAAYGFNQTLPFAINALTAVFSVIALSSMRGQDFRPPVGRGRKSLIGSPVRELKECLSWLRNDGYLCRVLIVCTVANFAFQTIFLLLVVEAEKQHVSSALIGVLLAASGIGGALGTLLAPKLLKVLTPARVVLSSVCFWVTFPLTVMVTDRAVLGMAAWGLVSFMGANLNVALAVYLAIRVPERLMGRVTSVNGFLTRGAVPLGALSGGYVITHFNIKIALLVIAVVIVILALLISVRHPIQTEQDHNQWPSAAPLVKAARRLPQAMRRWRSPTVATTFMSPPRI